VNELLVDQWWPKKVAASIGHLVRGNGAQCSALTVMFIVNAMHIEVMVLNVVSQQWRGSKQLEAADNERKDPSHLGDTIVLLYYRGFITGRHRREKREDETLYLGH
jgi:tetraacyldisaccharide-1-P 4'-kinase